MRRRTRLLLLAATVGLVAPVAAGSTSASAIDQDLQVSVTSGAPGTAIELSSASCAPESSDDHLRLITAQLISGTAPDEVLAGAATGFEDHDAVLVVPDWIDPAAPAVIEATCIEVTWDPVTDDITQTTAAFDPVAFDVEAGAGAPVQTRTFSRTSLEAGQAFSVDGTGCFLDGASYGGVDVVAGDDPSGRTMGEFVTSGGGELDGQDFTAVAALSAGGLSISGSEDSNGNTTIEVEEENAVIPEGPATAFPFCGDEEGTLLLYAPQLLDVTGTAPIDDIDLVVAPDTPDATLAGGSCDQGPVEAEIDAISEDEFWGEDGFLIDGSDAGSAAITREARASLLAGLRADHGVVTVDPATASLRHSRSARGAAKGLADDGWVFDDLTPDAQGAWSLSDSVGFELGWVEGYATCGDPLADGFIYDAQAAVVDWSEAEPTTTTTTTAVPPAPANAIPGTPTYAG